MRLQNRLLGGRNCSLSATSPQCSHFSMPGGRSSSEIRGEEEGVEAGKRKGGRREEKEEGKEGGGRRGGRREEGEKSGGGRGREGREEEGREGRAEVILQHLPHRTYCARKAQCGYGLLLSNSMLTIYTGNKYRYQ